MDNYKNDFIIHIMLYCRLKLLSYIAFLLTKALNLSESMKVQLTCNKEGNILISHKIQLKSF